MGGSQTPPSLAHTRDEVKTSSSSVVYSDILMLLSSQVLSSSPSYAVSMSTEYVRVSSLITLQPTQHTGKRFEDHNESFDLRDTFDLREENIVVSDKGEWSCCRSSQDD